MDHPGGLPLRDGRPSPGFGRLPELRPDRGQAGRRASVAPLLAVRRVHVPPGPVLPGVGEPGAMNPMLAGVALAVAAGAVIAASAREARAALIGVVLAL